MARILANLKGVEHAEWLEKRLSGIGGSEAAAACGVDKYMSKLELWARKTGRWNSENECNSERIRLGRDLEYYIAKRFSEATGKEFRVSDAMYMHDEFDCIIADLDGVIVGENAGLECRTVNSAFEKLPEKFEELPRNLLAQCYHYLAVMNFERIYLALLDLFSGELKIFEIPFDEKKCAALLECELRFWNDHVMADIRPRPDGSDSADEALKRLAKPICEEPIDFEIYSESVGELYGLRQKIKEFEVRERVLRQELIDALDGNSNAFTEKFRINFTRQSRKILDQKLLKENHAEIFRECLRESPADILKISEI